MKIKHSTIITLVFLLLFNINFSFGQTTYTWKGGNGDWNVSSNWSPNGIPGTRDYIILKSGRINIQEAHTIAGFDLRDRFFLNSSDASLTITDSANWSAGQIYSGKVIVAKSAVLVLNGIGAKSLVQGTSLVNEGTIKFEGSGGLYISQSSILENNSLFDIVSDADFGGSGEGGTFRNNGILRKSEGNGLTNFTSYWNFKNQNSTIEVLSGTLKFSCKGTFTGGIYYTSADATLNFYNQTQIFKDTLSGSPAGVIKYGSNLQVDNEGATLNFGGTGFQWSAGRIEGGGTLTNSSTGLLVLNGIGAKSLVQGTSLVNEGTIKFEGSGGLYISQSSILENNSLFDIVSDADFGGSGEGGTFINNGILRKSEGLGISNIYSYWNFKNRPGGLISANSGKLKFTNLINETDAVIQGSATIDVPYTSKFIDNGVTSPGEPIGQLSYLGDYVPNSTSILKIELGGQTEYDRLVITGKAILNGTLEVSLVNNFVPAVGDTFVILTASKTVADSFTTILNNSGLDFDVQINPNKVMISINSVTGIERNNETKEDIPNKFELNQNYPNPFNPTTTISYTIPKKTHSLIPSREGKERSGRGVLIKLKVYDILGNEVATLVNEKKSPGTYEVTFDASNLSSGIYFYKFQTGNFVETKKMILLR